MDRRVNGAALKLFDPILAQVNNAGEEETVAFASCSLSDAERKYSNRGKRSAGVYGLLKNDVCGSGEGNSCYAPIIKH